MHCRLARPHGLVSGGRARPASTRLEAAGAIAIGRSNVPEFCYRGTTRNELYGQTGNPFAPDRSAGGSSGGAASAVALGVGELALGSDGGGSIRIPASFCGIGRVQAVTYGLVPRTHDIHGWLLLTHFGPLTRTVGRVRSGAHRAGGPRPARSALAAGARPRLRVGRARARRALAPARGGLGRPRATSASTTRCGSASRRPSRRSPTPPGRRSSGRTPSSPRRSRSGTRSRAATTPRARVRCSASGLVGDDARALIEEGFGLSVRAVRDGAQPSARDRDRVGHVPRALRPVADADDGMRRVPALGLGAA